MDSVAPAVTAKISVRLSAFRSALQGRPWLSSADVLRAPPGAGPFVDLVDENELNLGTGLYNSTDPFPVRLLASARTRDPLILLRTRLERAAARRRLDLLGADAFRLCHAEADGVPRLFVDRFGEGLFITSACPAMDEVAPLLLPDLMDITQTAQAVLWKRGPNGHFEGKLIQGESSSVRFHHGRLVRELDLLQSFTLERLTALFDAQRQLRRWAKGRALDLSGGYGGFALQLADAGAQMVRCVEPSEQIAEVISADARRNGLEGRVDVSTGDAESAMAALDDAGERYDILILPPDTQAAFEAKDDEALRRRVLETHHRALRLLDEGRLLLTWPDAAGLSEEAFFEVLGQAAARHRMRFQLLARLDAGPDHPFLLGLPESRPAPVLVLRVISTA